MTKDMDKRDLYQEVTDKIVAALEEGTVPWVKPWDSRHASVTAGYPCNALTGRPYHGVNVPLLWLEQTLRGFTNNRWITFRQAKEVGGHVKRGEKGTLVTFFKPIRKQLTDESGNPRFDDNGNPLERTIPLLKGFTVFNVDQIQDLPEEYLEPEVKAKDLPEPLEAAETVIAATGADIRHGGPEAYYAPLSDHVQMPPGAAFLSQEGYYGTLLHELTHWTGHGSRLARDGIVHFQGFGSSSYAFEELVAELGGAFLCAETGIQGDLRHEGYIASWLEVLRGDKRAIFRASTQARRSTEYLMAQTREGHAAAEGRQVALA
ncbi:ArdC family protein [Aquisalimonas asiatica]|uniref:Antirestriction protein ArdC n=1 Tax=Aquisalimonas asiatica TaxID=406100 RepID=A0A1H8VR09_9GAMM|nr:zincin-like metallopeptidase domain-containing protein [Aquisalimonas asiatica]SEP17667.1 Antirestriction protein ArdC [Aquisalimonas asiatica]